MYVCNDSPTDNALSFWKIQVEPEQKKRIMKNCLPIARFSEQSHQLFMGRNPDKYIVMMKKKTVPRERVAKAVRIQ